jgi:mannose-6-phosphate isomerase
MEAEPVQSEPLYPLRFEPILKELIWGGRRLERVLGKSLGPGTQYAESWEISDHRQDVSVVAEGPLAGTSLRALVRDRTTELLGPRPVERAQFPLLVKFIDAHQVLSVQVHPDDEQGRVLANDNGKTEAWVILHAEPGSLIYAGLRAGVTRSDFTEALASGAVEPLLHRFEAKPGDCILIPAGTIHAIGAGVVLAEIQQMSDATFRVHDWGRLGTDGKPRQLHVEQALACTDFAAGPVNPWPARPEPCPGGTREALARSAFFALERFRLGGPASVGTASSATIVLGMGGTADVRHGGASYPLGLGQTLLLPACLGPCEVVPRPGGEAEILTCVVP